MSYKILINALDPAKYDIFPIGITPQGRWISGEKSLQLLKRGTSSEELISFLPADPIEKGLIVKKSPALIEKLDVIFPVLHGSYGEDGTIQGLLELADLPYVGASVLGSSLAMDKILQKQITNQAGVPSVEAMELLLGKLGKTKSNIEFLLAMGVE